MTRSLDIAATGMMAQQTYVDVTSQNLANINTTGFKRERAQFETLLYQDQQRMGVNSSDTGTIIPTGIQIGLGVRTAAIYRNSIQGAMQQTENTFDLGVQGKGYFQVQLPSGEIGYTRDGAFQLSDTGEIVTNEGFPVLPSITIPQGATSVTVNSSGEVFAKLSGQVDPQNLGQLQLSTFLNEAGLDPTGNNMYLESTASGSPTVGNPNIDGVGSILQGFLENSNINPITELTNLIRAQRAYEQCSRVISKTDQMLQALTQVTS